MRCALCLHDPGDVIELMEALAHSIGLFGIVTIGDLYLMYACSGWSSRKRRA